VLSQEMIDGLLLVHGKLKRVIAVCIFAQMASLIDEARAIRRIDQGSY